MIIFDPSKTYVIGGSLYRHAFAEGSYLYGFYRPVSDHPWIGVTHYSNGVSLSTYHNDLVEVPALDKTTDKDTHE